MKINSLFNILGSSLFTLFCFFIFPVFLSIMPKEEYGLFSLFFVILIYSKFLELGIGNTLVRYISNTSTSITQLSSMRILIRTYEVYFLILSLLIIIFFSFFGISIIKNWLHFKNLELETVTYSILTMIIIVCLKYYINIYRSSLNGFEKQVITNSLRILSDFFSLIGGLLIYYLSKTLVSAYSPSLILYFFICIVNLIELLLLKNFLINEFTRKKIPSENFSFKPLNQTIKFSLFSSLISIIWISVTWLDRVIWSSILNLEHYGYFVTTTFFASVVIFFISSINLAILPRLSKLHANNDNLGIFKILRISNYFTSFICFSLSFFILFYSYDILLVWTGNIKLTIWSNQILILYALAYGIISLTHIYSTLLNAFGSVYLLAKILFIWSIFISLSFVINAYYFTIESSALIFLILNLIYFILFILFLNKKFSEFNFIILLKDTFLIGIIFFILYFVIYLLTQNIQINSRLIKLIQLTFVFIIPNLIVLFLFSVFRKNLYNLILEILGNQSK